MAKSDLNDEFALYSLRIFGTTTLAIGGDISEQVIQKKGGDSPTRTRRIRVITADSKRVSRKLVVAREGNERQPREGTAGGGKL